MVLSLITQERLEGGEKPVTTSIEALKERYGV
jgi:hypothetical protein